MNKTITLEGLDPIEILGVNNKLFDQFKAYFPQLKAVSRGNEIILTGSDAQIAMFEEKLGALIQKRMGKMNLNSYDVESLFEAADRDKEVGKVDMLSGSEYIIVYGSDGKCVKARTVNQKRLVKEYYDNDLIFALGPAGQDLHRHSPGSEGSEEPRGQAPYTHPPGSGGRREAGLSARRPKG